MEKWEGIKDKGQRIKDEREQEERRFSRFSALIPYPFSYFAISP
jgi:hypothetical protein